VAKQKRRGGNQVDVRPAPPVVDLDAKPELAEGEEPKPKPKQQIELFKLDGKAYYMAEPGANLMLKVMKTARTEGMIGAVGELLEELICDQATANGIAFVNLGNALPSAHLYTIDVEWEE